MATEAEFKNNKYKAMLKELKHNRTTSYIKSKNPNVKFVSYDPEHEYLLIGNKKDHKVLAIKAEKSDDVIVEQVNEGISDNEKSTPVYHRRIIGSRSVNKIYPEYDFTWYGVDQFYGVKAGKVEELGYNLDGSPSFVYFHGIHGWGDDYWDKYIVSHNNGVETNGYTVTEYNARHFKLVGLKAADIINSELIINYIKNRKDLRVVNAYDNCRCVALNKSLMHDELDKSNFVLQCGMSIFLWKENGSKRRFTTEFTRTNIPRTEVVWSGSGEIDYSKEIRDELNYMFKYPGITSRRQTVYCAEFDVTSLDYRCGKAARYGSPFTTLEAKNGSNSNYFCLVPASNFESYTGQSVLKNGDNSIITSWDSASNSYAYSESSKAPVFTLHEDVEGSTASLDEEIVEDLG